MFLYSYIYGHKDIRTKKEENINEVDNLLK